MYNLLVTSDEGRWDRPDCIFDATRYLEHTDPALKARLKPMNDGVAAKLMAVPTVFAYETTVAAPARVGWLRSIKTRGDEIRVTFAFDSSLAPIAPEDLDAMSWDLDIRGEMNRTHWAVKDRDLLGALRSHGFLTTGDAAKREYKFTRQTLLKACSVLRSLGHTGFDHFLLELGVGDLHAGRDRGGLLARANALAEYVLGHPNTQSAEGEPLSLAVTRRAAQLDPNYPGPGSAGIQESLRTEFWTGLKRDGYTVSDGNIVALAGAEAVLIPPYAKKPTNVATEGRISGGESSSMSPTRQMTTPCKLFYSYAHKDEALREDLETHLKLLHRQGLLESWHDRRIIAGTEWANVIDENLERADVILLLVSANFIASDYCFDNEMKRAMERHHANQACVIPILLKPCDWSGTPFAQLQALPRDAKPVTLWPNQDEAWTDVAKGIRSAIGERPVPC